ncbi:MAG: hypothetical protein ACE5OZ_17595 [Candidatus Heimdallarchaeota archaeon]
MSVEDNFQVVAARSLRSVEEISCLTSNLVTDSCRSVVTIQNNARNAASIIEDVCKSTQELLAAMKRMNAGLSKFSAQAQNLAQESAKSLDLLTYFKL